MTSVQEQKDTRQFLILFAQGWINLFLVIVLVLVYVSSCRQADMSEIKNWIESIRCECHQRPQHNIDQHVNIAPNDREENAYRLVRERDKDRLKKDVD